MSYEQKFLDDLPRNMHLRHGPIPLDIVRGAHVTVRIPQTTIMGVGSTDEDALANLSKNVAWWFLYEGPRLSSPLFQHTLTTRSRLAQYRVVESLIEYEPGDVAAEVRPKV